MEPGDVIAHLERTIAWYRHVWAAEQLTGVPTDLVVRDATLQRSLQALQLAFDFGRAEAAFLAQERRGPGAAANLADAGAAGQSLSQAATNAAQRVTQAETRLNDLSAQLGGKVPAKERPLVEARRRETEAQLTLARQVQTTIQGMLNIVGETGLASGGGSGLLGQIGTLERSVPEARHPPKKSGADTAPAEQTPAKAAAANPNAAATATVFHAESAGLLMLATELITLQRAKGELDGLLKETDALLKSIDRLKAPIVDTLRTSMRRSQALVSNSDGQDVAQIQSDQREIEALTIRFKQLSTATVPIGEQQLLVETTRTNLAGWRNSISSQASQAAKYLILRIALIVLAIMAVLAVSSVLDRVMNRYISDPRRKRQFLVLRRVGVTLAVIVIVAIGFVTDFGSIATYAGFLTAGIALGLQNVILSVVAYFFLIGKYGIKVGDRVTISGVTGDVIDVGLVRMYMMELAGTGADMHPTGRTVVYANSIVFQPSALFKQVPGTDYVWHTVSLTLKAPPDHDAAKHRLTGVVNAVYADYRTEITGQHHALERSVEMAIEPPEPGCKLTVQDGGLEFRARYPVSAKRAAAMDDQMLKALRAAVSAPPALELITPPRLV